MTISEVKQTVNPTRSGAEIGILVYPNSQAAAVHGLTDLFCAANAIHRARGGSPCDEILVSHGKMWSRQILWCRNGVLNLMRQEEPPVAGKLSPRVFVCIHSTIEMIKLLVR